MGFGLRLEGLLFRDMLHFYFWNPENMFESGLKRTWLYALGCWAWGLEVGVKGVDPSRQNSTGGGKSEQDAYARSML